MTKLHLTSVRIIHVSWQIAHFLLLLLRGSSVRRSEVNEASAFGGDLSKGRFPLRRNRPRDQAMGVSGHAQLEIQAESERLLANAGSVLEVESSSTFLRPE